MNDTSYILIVDDNKENLKVVFSFLHKLYKIAVALDGKNALAILEETNIDLVLLDIMMPEMDGFEVCRLMKENPKTRNIPIIFLTAKTESEDIVKGFDLGGVDYLSKPIRSPELLARINTHLTISHLQKKLLQNNEQLEQIVEKRTSELVVANAELNNKVLELKAANEIIEQAANEKNLLLKQMILSIIESEENERMRISQELHDGLGPILTTIKLYLQCLQRADALNDKLELVGQTLDITEEAILNVKEISNKLSPHVLTKYGLKTAIESFINKINVAGRLNISTKILLPDKLQHNIEILLYRVVIECLNNTVKYANAQHVSISIYAENELLILKYADNGKGFDFTAVKKGLGLLNIQNRVETMNGIFNINASEGTGMELTINMPYANCKL